MEAESSRNVSLGELRRRGSQDGAGEGSWLGSRGSRGENKVGWLLATGSQATPCEGRRQSDRSGRWLVCICGGERRGERTQYLVGEVEIHGQRVKRCGRTQKRLCGVMMSLMVFGA